MNYTTIWSEQAKIDAINSINRASLYYRSSKIKFFNKLRKFLEILNSMPRLGKVISNYDFEIRQIIYQKYRILYTIENDKIYILRIIHTRMNFENNFRFLNDLIS